jgi:hypothetical protein
VNYWFFERSLSLFILIIILGELSEEGFRSKYNGKGTKIDVDGTEYTGKWIDGIFYSGT